MNTSCDIPKESKTSSDTKDEMEDWLDSILD